MAAQDTRTFIVTAGDYYLCPLPQVQLAEGELDEALEAVWSGEQALSAVWREQDKGPPQLIAEGYECEVPMSEEVEGQAAGVEGAPSGSASVRHAQAAEAAPRARVAKAKARLRPSTDAAAGKKRFETVADVTSGGAALSSVTASRTSCGFDRPPHHDTSGTSVSGSASLWKEITMPR